jgi:hypothetical protein
MWEEREERERERERIKRREGMGGGVSGSGALRRWALDTWNLLLFTWVHLGSLGVYQV